MVKPCPRLVVLNVYLCFLSFLNIEILQILLKSFHLEDKDIISMG